MFLPDAIQMQDITPPPSENILQLGRIQVRHYTNAEFGIQATAQQSAPGRPIVMQYRADCLPGRTFRDFNDLREAYNALPGNARPTIYINSPGRLQ